MRCLVTGATGFLGGHVAETLRARGDEVVTIARASSDTSLLKKWGVEIVTGDLTDPQAIKQVCANIDAVVHCAAKVGEWGAIDEYRKVNVEALRLLLDECVGKPLQRFVLISSLGIYPARDHEGTTEETPPPARHIDSYTQTKVEAEQVAFAYRAKHNLPLVVLRPGFIYGPRDRTVMPRILFNLKWRLVSYFGSREKKINNTYVGNVVAAVLLALEKPAVIGQAYNIRDPELVSKKVFFETIADLSKLPRPLATWPMPMARALCGSFEALGKTFGFAPLLNSARLKFMGLNLDYSIDKARAQLGYNPSTCFAEGIAQTIAELRQAGKIK